MRLQATGIILFGIASVCGLQAPAGAVTNAEPASILYMLSGGVAFLFTRSRYRGARRTGTAMLFCSRSSRETIAGIRLL